jgi:hypothetical protein
MLNRRSRIQDLCSEALAATDTGQIEPILSELKSALRDQVENDENRIALLKRAAVESDPRKLLDLVSEINRLFGDREKSLFGKPDVISPGRNSTT